MKKVFLFMLMLSGLTYVSAADGTLTISNAQNAVPGYTGNFDVVLSGADRTYVAMQFDVTLPDGLSLVSPLTDCYSAGELVNGHTFRVSDQGCGKYRITCYADPTASFTAANGTVLTLYYNVASETAIGDKTATLSDVTFSYNYVSYHPSAGDNTITIGNTVMLTEDETAAPAASSATVNVTVNRALKGDKWNTIVLPFAMTSDQLTTTFGGGVKLAGFDDYTTSGDNISVSFVTSDVLQAHTPYIIKVSTDMSSFSVSGVTITTANGDLTTGTAGQQMIGTYVAETTIPDKGIFLSDNEFKFSKGTSKLKAFRAWFSFADFNYAEAGARRMVLDVFDMSTGIHSISSGIKADGNAYNLKGQKVNESSRGVQIRNGKKVIKK